jgi:hypothetical protein
MACPASVRASEGAPNESSEFAAEGTVLHEIAAWCIEFGFEPDDFVGRWMRCDDWNFLITEELVSCIYEGLDWIRELPGEQWVEKRVDLSRWMPGQFGTMDLGFYDPTENLMGVFDWKFGAGVPVDVVGNKQARAYGLGFYDTFLKPRGIHPHRVQIFIEQPRCPGGCRYSDPWEITLDELLEFGEEMRAAFEAAQDPDAPFGPGEETCRFCDARKREPAPGDLTGCRAYDRFVINTMSDSFDDLDDLDGIDTIELDPNPTPARRATLVKNAKMIERYLAEQHEMSVRAAESGNPDPGLKMVAGRMGHRKWADADKAEAILKKTLAERGFTYKVKSPAQAEPLLRPRKGFEGHPEAWKRLKQLIQQDEGKPVLVAEENSKPVLPSMADDFEDL